jgi:FkbM family methyltransferase
MSWIPRSIKSIFATTPATLQAAPQPHKEPQDELFDIFEQSAIQNGIVLEDSADLISFKKEQKLIRIHKRHFVYSLDIIENFDFYFQAVRSSPFGAWELVDYSFPRYHEVTGYDRHPIYFPSLSEPIETARQYLGFYEMGAGDVVLDLGAYSGLTSILFKDIVGEDGVVVAVDADSVNVQAMRKNFALYKRTTDLDINLIEGAVWSDSLGVEFSTEGNMGSSAIQFVGAGRGSQIKVPSFTLSKIIDKYELDKVNFIKCDIEGAESRIFEDADFMNNFHPAMIIEIHPTPEGSTLEKVQTDLEKFGYKCTKIEQVGCKFPLLQCE